MLLSISHDSKNPRRTPAFRSLKILALSLVSQRPWQSGHGLTQALTSAHITVNLKRLGDCREKKKQTSALFPCLALPAIDLKSQEKDPRYTAKEPCLFLLTKS